MPTRVIVPALVAVLALAGCGGDDTTGDRVPASLPELTVPQAGVAPSDGSPATGTTDTTPDTDTTDTAATDTGAAGGAAGGAPVTPVTPAPTQSAPPANPGGASAAPTTPTPEPEADSPDVGGASPSGGELQQFCDDNPGAC